MTQKKQRADVLLVAQGLAASRPRAQALILSGNVYADHNRIDKAGQSLASDTVLRVKGNDNPFVSRGGIKLAGALEYFNIQVRGSIVADFGASTGGFTDCALQAGAARVYAIDVGYGQLAEKLRRDHRVICMERTNARHMTANDIPEPVDIVVIDASFIGLAKLLPAAYSILKGDGQVVALLKPQFEVGREKVGRGVVRDEAVRQQAALAVKGQAALLGFDVRGQVDSVLMGPKGNREIFLLLQKREIAL
ncbi:MAG: TlyA family RNA methyltransferase [Myxococcales bacterium]|nr:TlyA family RNA methyltransferase [Myxococcales bacterium]